MITLNPELVEKKEPPIITRIKNKKYKFGGILLNEIPMLETLLEIVTSIVKKLLLLKKTNIIEIIINKYTSKLKYSLR